MVIEPAFGTVGSVQVPSPAWKWNQHLHKACQQKEAWSALKCSVRCLCWLWTSENTADQHQQMTRQPKPSLTVETSHWTSRTWILCLSSLPPDSGTLIYKLNAKFTFIRKEGFGALSNSPVLLLMMFLFQKWLVDLFLKMSERGDSWFSFSSLLVKLSRVFESALLDSILKLAVIPVACAHFPTQFLPSSQLCI